ncbi:MAG TPA: DUF6265 family protein [Gemmatimonadaceae bacterium]
MIRRCLFLVALSVSVARAQSVPRPPSPKEGTSAVQQLSWLAGCWQRRTSSGGVVEEQWMTPRAGFTIGMSRTVRGDSMVVEYEQLRIFQRAGKAVYHAEPSGQTPTDFEAAATGDTLVVFENAAHDFPQRVIYRKRGADSLIARIEGTLNGQVRAVDFPYARVRCP